MRRQVSVACCEQLKTETGDQLWFPSSNSRDLCCCTLPDFSPCLSTVLVNLVFPLRELWRWKPGIRCIPWAFGNCLGLGSSTSNEEGMGLKVNKCTWWATNTSTPRRAANILESPPAQNPGEAPSHPALGWVGVEVGAALSAACGSLSTAVLAEHVCLSVCVRNSTRPYSPYRLCIAK